MCNTIYLYSWSNLPDAITIASSRVIVFDNSISVIFLLWNSSYFLNLNSIWQAVKRHFPLEPPNWDKNKKRWSIYIIVNEPAYKKKQKNKEVNCCARKSCLVKLRYYYVNTFKTNDWY